MGLMLSAVALVDERQQVSRVVLGDEHGSGGDELSPVGKDSVQTVFGEEHDREIPLQEGLLVGRERDLAILDRGEDLRADSECGVGEPAE
jgi:hypothetical protein